VLFDFAREEGIQLVVRDACPKHGFIVAASDKNLRAALRMAKKLLSPSQTYQRTAGFDDAGARRVPCIREEPRSVRIVQMMESERTLGKILHVLLIARP
jgi:hypothetical protein